MWFGACVEGPAPPGSRRRSGAIPSDDPERSRATLREPERSYALGHDPGGPERGGAGRRREPAIKCNRSANDEGPGIIWAASGFRRGLANLKANAIELDWGDENKGLSLLFLRLWCEAYFQSALLERTPNGRTHLPRARARKLPARNDVVLRRSRAIERQPRKTRESAAAVA